MFVKHDRLNSTPIIITETTAGAPDVSNIIFTHQQLRQSQTCNTDTEYDTSNSDTLYVSVASCGNTTSKYDTTQYVSVASGYDDMKYSAQDIAHVIGDSSAKQDHNYSHCIDSKLQPEVFRSVENDALSFLTPYSYFSIEESALLQNQSHLMLNSDVFETEHIPYSTPKLFDFDLPEATKNLSGSFIDDKNKAKSTVQCLQNNDEQCVNGSLLTNAYCMQSSLERNSDSKTMKFGFNKRRSSLSQAELLDLPGEQDCSQMINALDIVESSIMTSIKHRAQSDPLSLNYTGFESLFHDNAICVPVIRCSKNKVPPEFKRRSFSASFRKRTARVGQSLRKTFMKRNKGLKSEELVFTEEPLHKETTV